jgi:hypothetical protein
MRRTALWCHPCIREAEQRSLHADEGIDYQDLQAVDSSLPSYDLWPPAETPGAFGALLQEHLSLMEEALLEEDDDTIASRINDFMARARTHLDSFDDPEQVQRLTTHLNYWQTFLKALNQ